MKLYWRGRNNLCQRDNNAKCQLKQLNDGRSISHMDSVRLCDYTLIHTNTKEHREPPATWAEPLEHSDLVPIGAPTGQRPVHCQWVRPTRWVNSRISPDQLADWRGMLPTDHGAEYEMLGLKKQVFRGRTRRNKERDKIQLDGKRVEN